MLKLLIPSVLAALLYKYGKNVSAAADRLTYSPGIPRFHLFLLKPSSVDVPLKISNPTRTELFFDRIDLAASWGTYTLGNVVLDRRSMIPANGSVDVVIPFILNKGGILQAIFAAFKAKKFGTLTVKGSIVAGIIKVPVEFEQNLGGQK